MVNQSLLPGKLHEGLGLQQDGIRVEEMGRAGLLQSMLRCSAATATPVSQCRGAERATKRQASPEPSLPLRFWASCSRPCLWFRDFVYPVNKQTTTVAEQRYLLTFLFDIPPARLLSRVPPA